MKKIFLIIMAFAFIGAQGQVQNSSLQKGLIADIALSEWHVQPGAAQTSGTVTSGSTYILALFVAGDDFTNIGAVNVSGSVFKATGTTPTTWTNSSIVRPYNSTVTELISRTAGTNTAVTVVTGKNGQGSDRYNSYNGTSSYTNIDNAVAGLTGTTTGSILWKGSILDFTTNYKRLWAFGDTNADENIQLTVDATDYKLYGSCIVAATSKWVFTTDNTFSASTIYSIIMVHNGTTPLLYVNGVLQALTFSDETDKTAWFSQATGIDNGRLGCINYNSGGNANFLNCRIYDFGFWNRALSIGEVQAYSNATTEAGDLITGLRYRILTLGNTTWNDVGAGAGAVVGTEFTATGVDATATEGTCKPLSTSLTFADKGATNTSLVTGDNSTFTSGVGSWTGDRSGSIAAVGGQGEITSGAQTFSGTVLSTITTIGKRYKISFDYILISGNARQWELRAPGASDTYYITPSGGSQTFSEVFTAVGTGFTIVQDISEAGNVMAIDNVSCIPIGNTLNLDASGIRPTTWFDSDHSITGTNTSVTPVIPPDSELQAMDFNGSTSRVVYTGMDGLTGDVTISCSIYLRGWGETDGGRIIDNGQFILYTYKTATALRFIRDDNVAVNSGGDLVLNAPTHICVTSTSTGVTNFYINGVLSGTPNQSMATPVSGTTWYVGNRDNGGAYDKTFDGMLSPIRIYDRVLTATEVLDLYNKTK